MAVLMGSAKDAMSSKSQHLIAALTRSGSMFLPDSPSCSNEAGWVPQSLGGVGLGGCTLTGQRQLCFAVVRSFLAPEIFLGFVEWLGTCPVLCTRAYHLVRRLPNPREINN